MSIVHRQIAGALVVALLLAGSAAEAAKYRLTFRGTVASGSDTGLFGVPGSLAGERFAATYTYDTLVGDRHTVPGVSDHVFPVLASLTIKGTTYDFPKLSLIFADAFATPGRLDMDFLSAIDADPVDIETLSNTAFSPLLLASLDFAHEALIPVTGSGDFGVSICCCPDCGPSFIDVFAEGRFVTDSLKIAIPEPATWALMLAGFGVAGAALRRRRGGGVRAD